MNFVTNAIKPVDTAIALGDLAADADLPLTITRCQHGDAEFTTGGGDAACVVLILSEGQIVERKSRGVWSHRPSKLGLITVVDPDEITKFTIRGQAKVARLFIPVTNLAEAAGLARRPNVKARFIEPERNLERGAQRAIVAMHEGAGSDPLLLSSLVMALSRTVIEQPVGGSNRAIGGLARRQLRRVEELIASRLAAPITSSPSLRELAAEANLSLHHFAREFRRTVGVSPYAYMLRCRLDRARRLVINSDLPMARIGVISGFPSAAHFADRFHREMGTPPAALRRAAQA